MLDVLVVGSGPAGLGAAIYAKRANLNVLVAEKEYLGTGQIAESGQVDNYLGLVGMNGYDLGEKFRNDASGLGVEFFDGEVKTLEKTSSGWNVSFTNGEIKKTKTVIYAAGASHRHLGLEEENTFLGKGVSYCAVCDGAFFRGKVTAVIGGGDTALDDALYLSEICEKVYLIHRRQEFRGSAKTLEKIRQQGNVEIITDAQVVQIVGDSKVEAIHLSNGQELAVNGVFVAIGMIPQNEAVKDIVRLDENGYVLADETGNTSAEGLFVAGDVRTKALRQVVTAVSDGANAAISAANYIKE